MLLMRSVVYSVSMEEVWLSISKHCLKNHVVFQGGAFSRLKQAAGYDNDEESIPNKSKFLGLGVQKLLSKEPIDHRNRLEMAKEDWEWWEFLFVNILSQECMNQAF